MDTNHIKSHLFILENSDLCQIVLHLWGISFILKLVHFMSIHFSVFVYVIPKQNFLPVQVIIEWVNSYFQSQRNSYSCTKSCKPKTSGLKTWQLCSPGPVVYAYLIWRGSHASHALGWASQFSNVNAIQTSLWKKSHCGIILAISELHRELGQVSNSN